MQSRKEKLVNELNEYEFNNHLHKKEEIIEELVRGEVRQLAFSKLLDKKHLPLYELAKFFISKTQAMPFINQLQGKGYIIITEMHIFLDMKFFADKERFYFIKKGDKSFLQYKDSRKMKKNDEL